MNKKSQVRSDTKKTQSKGKAAHVQNTGNVHVRTGIKAGPHGNT